MTMPDKSISSGTFYSGPNGLSNRKDGQPDLSYAESGGWKNCQSGADCKLHPYGTWRGVNGDGDGFTDTSILLGGNVQYHYYVSHVFSANSRQFQSVFCDGSGCRGIITTRDMGTNSLPYVFSGGESFNTGWGGITTRYAAMKFNNSSSLISWCYSTTNIQPSGTGTVSACNTSDHSWTSSKS